MKLLSREVELERLFEKDIEQYWEKKEDDIGEKIRGRMLAEFISPHKTLDSCLEM
jgi:hypothetical protein